MPRLRIGGLPKDSFQRVGLNVTDVIFVQKTLLDARQDFLAAGDAATAAQIAVIFDRFVSRIRSIAEQTAATAEKEIVTAVDQSRVRPDTGRGRVKLRNVIKAEAWDPTQNVATGTVSMGLHEALDKLPYWRVQEYGHRFTHTPKGFFAGPGYQGFSLPDPALFRQHPLFVATGKGKGGRRFLRPPVVHARHFLRDGTAKAVALWEAQTRVAIAETATQLSRLLARRGRGVAGRARRRRP